VPADPYKYFRIEARELLEGLNRGVLDLERGIHDGELVARLLRLAHTLKGAARVVKQPAIADAAHTVEDALAPHRGAPGPVPRGWAEEVLGYLDTIETRLTALDRPVEERPPVVASASEEAFTTVRVEIAEMDSLLEGLSEACVRLAALRDDLGALARLRRVAGILHDRVQARAGLAGARDTGTGPSALEELGGSLATVQRSLAARLDASHEQLLHVRDAVSNLRLVPAASLSGALQRAVRDAAQSVARRVEFELRGGEVRLDPHVLAALRDALLHVVRNSVAHGVEPEAERVAAGKPAAGRVQVDVERRGNRVVFACRDDGRGIDVEAVRRAAVQRGLLSAPASDSLSAAEVIRLILEGGVTTSKDVTQVSGRGIGLDVVRETAARLKGEVTVLTEAGVGTTVEVSVPVSLSLLAALAVDAAGVALLPLDAVRETLRLADRDVARSAGGDRILYDGQPVPFLPLADALGRPAASHPHGRPWSVVVVRSGSALVALGVERLLGITHVVVRPLPALAVADPVVACASIDADGGPQLMLDPAGIVAAATGNRPLAAEVAEPSRLPVLVVDDSLTTRMLEQSILESAGYEVDLASSAEEALVKARARRYGMFLVDVEMPGIDGFEFVGRTRTDPALRDVPAILITSRTSAEDRRRGAEAGARDYIAKSEFDQGRLLERIRELAG